MKNLLLFTSSLFILLFAGCASTKNSSDKGKVQTVKATYHHWTEKLPDSSLPENGIDIQLIFKNWPKNYEPVSVIFNHYKSGTAAVTDSTGDRTTISARIIRTSDVVAKTSSQTECSDRLIYTTASGDTAFVEIEQWQQAE